MFSKNYFKLVLMVAALLMSSFTIFAQTGGPVAGKVVLKDLEGKETPVEGAMVEVYRTDISSSMPSDKTNKKGEFSFASLPFGATFAFVVSGKGIDPLIVPNITASMKNATSMILTVTPGDGRTLTEAEVRDQLATALTGASGTQTAELTEEQKKKQAEMEAEIARIDAENKKKENFNATITRLIEEGDKAFKDKNYDLAIVKFEEGYQADTDFLGSAPGFLNNKGLTLRVRAVDLHNQGAGIKDDKNARAAVWAKSEKDFNESIDAYIMSWTLLKNATATQKQEVSSYDINVDNALTGLKDAAKYALMTQKADPSKLESVEKMLNELIGKESDKAKKAEAQAVLGDYLRAANEFDRAIVEYRKSLATMPDYPDALYGLGIALLSTGYNDDGSFDKARLQEAANHLKKFTSVAPAKHINLKNAEVMLEQLKIGNNITPK